MQTQISNDRSNTNNGHVPGFILTDEDVGATLIAPRDVFTGNDFNNGPVIEVTEVAPLPQAVKAKEELPVNPEIVKIDGEIKMLQEQMSDGSLTRTEEQQTAFRLRELKIARIRAERPNVELDVRKPVVDATNRFLKAILFAAHRTQRAMESANTPLVQTPAAAPTPKVEAVVETKRDNEAAKQAAAKRANRQKNMIASGTLVCRHPECDSQQGLHVPPYAIFVKKLGRSPTLKDLPSFVTCLEHKGEDSVLFRKAEEVLKNNAAGNKRGPVHQLRSLSTPTTPTETIKVSKSPPLTAEQIEERRLANIARNEQAKKDREKKSHERKFGTNQPSKADKKKAKADANAKKKR